MPKKTTKPTVKYVLATDSQSSADEVFDYLLKLLLNEAT